MTKTLGDISAIGSGYCFVEPDGELLGGLHDVFLQATAAPSGTVDELIKMVVGLLIGMLSKFLFAYIDKKFATKKIDTTNEKESKQKDSNPQ